MIIPGIDTIKRDREAIRSFFGLNRQPSPGVGESSDEENVTDDLYPFLLDLRKLLSDRPRFVLLNSYTAGLSPAAGAYVMSAAFPESRVTSDEVGLPVVSTGRALPCGIAVRAEFS